MRFVSSTLVVTAVCFACPSWTQGDALREPTVVHLGDSFVDAGLRQTLGPKFRAEHTRYIALAKSGSYLGSWAGTAAVDEVRWKWRPSLVLVTLGASETRAPPASRAPLVRRLSAQLHGIPCVWLTVPLWKNEPTALNDMIAKEAAPCRVFDPSDIASRIPRQRDGVHPTVPGGAVWAEAFWTWLLKERDTSRGPWGLKATTQATR